MTPACVQVPPCTFNRRSDRSLYSHGEPVCIMASAGQAYPHCHQRSTERYCGPPLAQLCSCHRCHWRHHPLRVPGAPLCNASTCEATIDLYAAGTAVTMHSSQNIPIWDALSVASLNFATIWEATLDSLAADPAVGFWDRPRKSPERDRCFIHY